MTAWIRRRPLWAFVVLAYSGSWLGWSPWWLSASGLGLLQFRLPLGAIVVVNQVGLFAGPFLASMLVHRVLYGSTRAREFLRRIFQFRTGWRALAMALIAVPAVIVVAYLLLGGRVVDGFAASSIVAVVVTYVVYLLGGPIQEEPGWRGTALPLLQGNLGPVGAAVVVGVLHTFWHTPLFFTEEWDTARGDAGQLVAYLVAVVSLSVVLTWIWNRSRGSVLPAILAHNGLNWALLLSSMLLGEEIADTWPAALAMLALAVAVIVWTRGRLGLDGQAQLTLQA